MNEENAPTQSQKAQEQSPKLDVRELEKKKEAYHRKRKKEDHKYFLVLGLVFTVIGFFTFTLFLIIGIMLLIVGAVRMASLRSQTE